MLLEQERDYGLGMDALVSACSWNTNGIMVWAWMLWSPYALGTRTELWFGHGGQKGHPRRCEYGHKMAIGSLASAQNPTPVSKLELLQPPQNRAVTPGWREKPVSYIPHHPTEYYLDHVCLFVSELCPRFL